MEKLLYFIFLTLLLISTYKKSLAKYYLVFKTITSILFCIIAILNLTSFNTLLIPIILCAIGDIFLGVYNRNNKLPLFIAGGLFFLCAHIGFLFHFNSILAYQVSDLVVPILSCSLVYLWDHKNVINIKKIRPLAYIYAFVIGLLLAKGMSILIYTQSTFGLLLSLATSLFYMSDCMIIFLYFQKKTPARHIFNLSTYYLSMFIFAMII